MSKIERLKEILNNTKHLVVFSGAGLSTNSGIPDFRSADGLYNQKDKSTFTPEEIVSHSFFMNYTKEFYDFYFKKMVYPNALPNLAHKYFAKLEDKMKVTIITQNIDDLHQMAGSSNVLELHGSVKRNYCMKCHKYYDIKDIIGADIPKCRCGGTIKPDVVLYEEPLDSNVIDATINAIYNCDTLIIVGTSLMVYPAASFVKYFRGNNLIVLNKTQTQSDNYADIVIHDDIKNVIEKLEK